MYQQKKGNIKDATVTFNIWSTLQPQYDLSIANIKINCLYSFHITSMTCIQIKVKEWRYTIFPSKKIDSNAYNLMGGQQNNWVYYLDKFMTNNIQVIKQNYKISIRTNYKSLSINLIIIIRNNYMLPCIK